MDVSDLLRQYGKEPGVLDNRALEQACTAIMACQVGPKGFAAAAVHCVCVCIQLDAMSAWLAGHG